MMNTNFQRNWPMTTDCYYQQQTEFPGYQALQIPNNVYHEQLPYTPMQSQININQQEYEQFNHINPQISYMMMDYQQPTQMITTPNRKARQCVSKSVKRERQLRRNERERERQGRLNSAFDVLRGSIPSFLAPYKHEQKLTQIETLRLAKYYISSLKGMLEDNEDTDCDNDDCDTISTSRRESSSSSEAGSS